MNENECRAKNELECKKIRGREDCTVKACSRLFALKLKVYMKENS